MGKRLYLAAFLALFAASALAQPVDVTYEAGLINVRCNNASIATVFESIEEATGIEMTLEDEVKDKRITADLVALPVAMAVQRLLEGTRVNYAVMMDPRDWERVDKIFIGAGGGGPARSAPPPRRAPVPPPEDDFDDFEEADEFDDFDDMEDDFGMDDDLVDDPSAPGFGGGADPNAPAQTPQAPNYLPPQQTFPRSSFTPGLPSQQPAQPGTAPQGGTNPPPPTFPFMDAFGNPVPVAPNQQQQQQQQQQQRQQQNPPQQ